MKGWMNGTSYAVTCMNADVAPAYCGMTVITGTFICWWYLSRFGRTDAGWLALRNVLAAAEDFYLASFYDYAGGSQAATMRAWCRCAAPLSRWRGPGPLLGLTKVSQVLLGWSRFETFLIIIPIICST